MNNWMQGSVLLPLPFLFLSPSSYTEGGATHVQPIYVRHRCFRLLVEPGDARATGSFRHLPSLLQLFKVGALVHLKPSQRLIASIFDCFKVACCHFLPHAAPLNGGLHVEALRFQLISSCHLFSLGVIVSFELLCIIHHLLNVLLREPALVVGYGDLVLVAGALVACRHIQDSVCVDLKSHLNGWDAFWSWWDACEIKASKLVIVASHHPLTLVHLNSYHTLVVLTGGEGLGLLGWDGCVPLNQAAHDRALSFDSKAKGGNVQQNKVCNFRAGVASQDRSLDSGTIGNCFIWVDRSVEFLAIEEVLQKLLNLWDPSGTSNKDNVA